MTEGRNRAGLENDSIMKPEPRRHQRPLTRARRIDFSHRSFCVLLSAYAVLIESAEDPAR
jgi:hypothetical protein